MNANGFGVGSTTQHDLKKDDGLQCQNKGCGNRLVRSRIPCIDLLMLVLLLIVLLLELLDCALVSSVDYIGLLLYWNVRQSYKFTHFHILIVLIR